MNFNATNYTVSILLIMALTIFIAGVRIRKPLENNWLLFYWIFVGIISIRYPEDTFDPRIIAIGVAAGLLLRFEFMGNAFVNLTKFVEAGVWAYILFMGFVIITTN